MFMVSQLPEAVPDLQRLVRAWRLFAGVRRLLGRFRFMFAPTIEQCLHMVEDLEKEFGRERAAAEVLGPSVITVRAWKRRRKMSVPSRRLVWLILALTLHPEQLQSVPDPVAWGRLRQPG